MHRPDQRGGFVLRVERSLIDDQSRTHGGAQGHALDVDTFGGGRLQTLEVRQQRLDVLLELTGFKDDLAHGAVNDAVLVGTETHHTRLGILDSGRDVRSNGAELGVRHEATRTEYLAQLTHNTHRIRRGDNHVIVQVAAFHLGSQLVHTSAIGASSQSCFGSRALGEHGNANGLAGAVRQNGCTTNDLIGFTRINTQADGDIEGFGELNGRQFGQQRCSLFETVLLARFDLLRDPLLSLGQLGHYTPSTFRPMLRAEPAMVRTAASSSAAVRSACLVLAISSSWARVTVPTFWVLGRAEPLVTPAAFFSSTAAGVLLVSKVKLRSL